MINLKYTLLALVLGTSLYAMDKPDSKNVSEGDSAGAEGGLIFVVFNSMLAMDSLKAKVEADAAAARSVSAQFDNGIMAAALANTTIPAYFRIEFSGEIQEGLYAYAPKARVAIKTVYLDENMRDLIETAKNKATPEQIKTFRDFYLTRFLKLESQRVHGAELSPSVRQEYEMQVMLARELSKINNLTEVYGLLIKLSALPEFIGYGIEFFSISHR